MMIKDLLLEKKITLADSIISGVRSFIEIEVHQKAPEYELVEHIQSGRFSKQNKIYRKKVIFMKKEIEIIRSKINSFEEKMPLLVDGYIFSETTNTSDFIIKLRKWISFVMNIIEGENNTLNHKITHNVLTERSIQYFNRINKEIGTFNEFIDYLHDVFSKEIEKGDKTVTMLFNPQGTDKKNILNSTLSFKLDLLEIPNEPILEKYVDDGEFVDDD